MVVSQIKGCAILEAVQGSRLNVNGKKCILIYYCQLMNSVPEKPKVIVICGPTGIGKTNTAIEIADVFNGEIIGADSMQIYRYMDIGTAKPTADEQERIPHHMIDIVDPDEHFDAARYAEFANDIVMQLHNKGITPFVVGGTGLYIKALLQGLFQSESIDQVIRNRLKEEAAEKGSNFLYDRLRLIDPGTANRLHQNDSYRIIRALETLESTGKSISEQQQKHGFADDVFDVLNICLHMDRQELYARINQRVDIMISSGFVEEVKKLLEMGNSPRLKSMQSIGYRHMVDFIEGRLPWDECIRTLKRDTRRFAKRQFTWFGADPDINWHKPDQLNQIKKQVAKFLSND